MAWRVAESLIKLRQQLNTAYPNRNKASDGTIGDPNHQAEGTGSDHNPNAAGVVCAFDITHDPASGLDIVKLAQALADSRDPRIKYLIRNSQIMVPADYGWKWVAYTGSNPHTSHLHVSVYGNYDDTTNWKIGEDMKADNYIVQALAEGILDRTAANDRNLQNNIGGEIKQVIDTIRSYPEAVELRKRARLYPSVKAENDTLKLLIAKLETAIKTTQQTQTPTTLTPGIYEVK